MSGVAEPLSRSACRTWGECPGTPQAAPLRSGVRAGSSAGAAKPLPFIEIAPVDTEEPKDSSTDSKVSSIEPVYPYEIIGATNSGSNLDQLFDFRNSLKQ